MIDPDSITHDVTVAAFRLAFIRRVGVGKDKVSYSDLQDGTGILVKTLKTYAEGNNMPQVDKIFKLCLFFGTDFASELLAIIGMGGVDWVESADSVNALASAARLSQAVSEITERLVDGVWCHRDCAAMGPKLLALSRVLEEQGKAMLDKVPR